MTQTARELGGESSRIVLAYLRWAAGRAPDVATPSFVGYDDRGISLEGATFAPILGFHRVDERWYWKRQR